MKNLKYIVNNDYTAAGVTIVMISLPLITHLIMVAHEVLPIKNNGLPKKKLIFILGHFE